MVSSLPSHIQVRSRVPWKPLELIIADAEDPSLVDEVALTTPSTPASRVFCARHSASRSSRVSARTPPSTRSRSTAARPANRAGSGIWRWGSGWRTRVISTASRAKRASASGRRSVVECDEYRPSAQIWRDRPWVVDSLTFSSLPSRTENSTRRARLALPQAP